MGGYISRETIDQISQQADIVQVISEYLPLTRAGKNYKALCPFHEEKTPSFIVSPERQVFHCFGCGVGGNVFTFVMKWENVLFPEAVRIVGEKIGVSITFEERESEYRNEFYKINEEVANFFHQQLKKNKLAQEYLYKRGIKPETIDCFKLGWAPSAHSFVAFCQRQNLPEDKLKELGLLKVSSRTGDLYPYFQKRIMFPIFSLPGKIIGFGARVLDNSLPKYLNSPQSTVFDKGKNLYGLHLVREWIRESGEVILVEGYTDVITLYQEGIRNVVASLGTSLTVSQIRLLKRYTDTVFMAYDEDSAGEAATLRGIDLLLERDLQIRVISLSRKDPAEFIQKEGKEAFLQAKNKALPYIDYRIELALKDKEPLTLERKLKVVNSLFFTLEKVRSRHILDDTLRKIAQSLDLNEESLRAEFNRFLREKTRFSFSPTLKFEAPEQTEIEKRLLQVMLQGKDVVEVVKSSFSIEDFTHPLCRRLAQELFIHEDISPAYLINRIPDDSLSSLISSLTLDDSSLEGVDLRQVAQEIIQTLKRRAHQERINELCRMIQESEQRGEETKVKKLCQQLVQLRKSILR